MGSEALCRVVIHLFVQTFRDVKSSSLLLVLCPGGGMMTKTITLKNTLGSGWFFRKMKSHKEKRSSVRCCDIFSWGLLNHHERRAVAPVPHVVIVSLMFSMRSAVNNGRLCVLKTLMKPLRLEKPGRYNKKKHDRGGVRCRGGQCYFLFSYCFVNQSYIFLCPSLSVLIDAPCFFCAFCISWERAEHKPAHMHPCSHSCCQN